MTITVSAMDLRHKLGEILNRVDLKHDHFIVERKGKPLAIISPMSSLSDLKLQAGKRIEEFIDSSASDLSDEEAIKIANEEIKLYRSEKRNQK